MTARTCIAVTIRTIAVSLLVLGLGAGPGSIADAAPGDPPAPLSLKQIGASPTITFPGQQGEVPLSIPVPDNLSPDVLRGVVTLPSFVTGGTVDVLQGTRLISRTQIPNIPNAPIALPLRGVTTNGNAADITLRDYLTVQGTCQFDPDNAFTIGDATVTFTGRESIPQTVAQFLPPILRQLTLVIPDDVQQAEGAAAVDLAAAVTAHYGSASVGVTTLGRPRSDMSPPSAPGPLERQIVIDSSAPPGLSLRTGSQGSAYLALGGPADQLVAQARFLTSNLASIALSSSAVAGPLYDAPQLAPDVTTLADLGIGDQEVTSNDWPSISIGIDQTRLGRPSKNIRVQLIGSYAPAGGDNAVISVRIGQRVIATLPIDSSGSFNSWVDLPDDAVTRNTELTLTLERGGVSGGCGSGNRSSLSLSSAGEITSDVADPPQPAGLGSVPESLMPWTKLAWTKGDVGDVTRAVGIAAGLQRLSVIPLGFDVVSMADAASSDQPAVLISADGKGLPALSLPVGSAGGTVTVRAASGSSAQVTLNPALRYGSLQTTQAGGRTVLVASSTGDASDLDDLLRWLGDDNRWTSLTGDALVKVRDQQPIYVDAAADAPQPEASSSDSGTAATVGIIVGVVAAVAIVAGGVIFVIRRRRRPGENDRDGR
ncbi:hypothetical protein ACPXB3_13000 [Gordonia sp. DT219]|uniref:hypothetical protein n=1 Tax=Gordonia sp. DT219 TaxID=3416658 RepID=UPI003CF9E182